MPQLDPELFAPQLVWLAITFLVLYILMSRLILPRVTSVLDQRAERIQGNLEKAEKLKEDAAAVLAAYQKAIADARAQAQAAMVQAAHDIAAETHRREAEFGKKLAEMTSAAEARIKEAKAEALAQVHNIASDVAANMAGKLIGAPVHASAAKLAVDAVLKERG